MDMAETGEQQVHMQQVRAACVTRRGCWAGLQTQAATRMCITQ